MRTQEHLHFLLEQWEALNSDKKRANFIYIKQDRIINIQE